MWLAILNVVLAKLPLAIAQIVKMDITYRIQVVYSAMVTLYKISFVWIVFKVGIAYNVLQICIYLKDNAILVVKVVFNVQIAHV